MDFLGDGSKLPVGWNLSVSGGTLPPYTFTPNDSSATVNGDPLFDILHADPVELQWDTNSFGPNDIGIPILDGFYNFNGQQVNLLGGEMNPTPEPATWALFGAGSLLLLGLAWRRRNGYIAFMHKAKS